MPGNESESDGGMGSGNSSESVGNGGAPLYAVVRIRGSANMCNRVKDALRKLRLRKVHSCTLLRASGTLRGMLLHAEDFITWGKVEEHVLEKMLEKRGKSRSGARIDAKHAKGIAKKMISDGSANSADVRPVFRLSPPSGGLRSVRIQYPRGDLGDRGERINDLLLRMI
jgi:large subunit ribosomal protein L30